MNIPSTLRAGDTYSWTESHADYPASAGWSLAFDLRSKDKSPITITATLSGDNYAIAITAAASRAWAAGSYSWQAYVYKGTPPDFTEKHSLAVGQIEILPDISQGVLTSDFRSSAQKNYEMITAALSGDTSPHVLSYSIGGRSLSKYSRNELIAERTYWKTEWDRERQADSTAQGLDVDPRRVGVRFKRV